MNRGVDTMPNTIAFDTLAYAKKLKSVGFTEEQAEVQAETLASVINERLATKQDILAMRRDMKELETSLRRDMKEIELRLKHDLTIRLGAMMTAGIAIVAALVKLL
jgi:predicted phage-related endonuclease